MQHFRIKQSVVVGIFLTLLIFSVSLFSGDLSRTNTASAADNPLAYKALFGEKCSACHNLPDPAVTQMTRLQWRATVDRMLNRHGASDSISPTESDQIVEYLSLFPPKVSPGSNSPLAIKEADVWSSDPTKSVVYTFSSADQLSAFHSQRGAWALTSGQTTLTSRPYLQQTQTMNDQNDTAVFMDTRERAVGDIDIQTQFRYLPNSTDQVVALLLSATDNRNYYVVRFDNAASTINVVEDKDGQFTTVGTAPTGTLVPPPDGWHSLRVIFHNDTQTLTVWVDDNKKAVVHLPDWSDNASFGLATQGATTAGFRNLTVDMYAPAG